VKLAAAGALATAATDRYLLPAPRLRQAADVDGQLVSSKPTAEYLSIDRADGQTDGRTPGRYLDAHRILYRQRQKFREKNNFKMLSRTLLTSLRCSLAHRVNVFF